MSIKAGHDVTMTIDHVLDASRWSRLHLIVVLAAAAAVLVDGAVNQSIGYALPSIAREFGERPDSFFPLLAAGLVGMTMGSLGAGLVADRIGRRAALLASILVFALAVFAMGFTSSLVSMSALRFLTGLGVGGALPCATTLVGEFTPKGRRTTMITATILCVPFGGMCAGVLAELVIPVWGWRGFLVALGGCSLVAVCVLYLLLPESPRFLDRSSHRRAELRPLLLRLGHDENVADSFSKAQAVARPVNDAQVDAPSVDGGFKRDSLALCIAFFSCLFVVYSAFNWLPTLMAMQGVELSEASRGLTAFNFGGIAGSLFCAWMIGRTGSRFAQVGYCLMAALTSISLVAMSAWAPSVQTGWLLQLGFCVFGFFVNGLQSTLFVLAAHIFPTRLRARGTACALASGFTGATFSTVIGAKLVEQGSLSIFLLTLALLMTLAGISIFTVKGSIQSKGR